MNSPSECIYAGRDQITFSILNRDVSIRYIRAKGAAIVLKMKNLLNYSFQKLSN